MVAQTSREPHDQDGSKANLALRLRFRTPPEPALQLLASELVAHRRLSHLDSAEGSRLLKVRGGGLLTVASELGIGETLEQRFGVRTAHFDHFSDLVLISARQTEGGTEVTLVPESNIAATPLILATELDPAVGRWVNDERWRMPESGIAPPSWNVPSSRHGGVLGLACVPVPTGLPSLHNNNGPPPLKR